MHKSWSGTSCLKTNSKEALNKSRSQVASQCLIIITIIITIIIIIIIIQCVYLVNNVNSPFYCRLISSELSWGDHHKLLCTRHNKILTKFRTHKYSSLIINFSCRWFNQFTYKVHKSSENNCWNQFHFPMEIWSRWWR